MMIEGVLRPLALVHIAKKGSGKLVFVTGVAPVTGVAAR